MKLLNMESIVVDELAEGLRRGRELRQVGLLLVEVDAGQRVLEVAEVRRHELVGGRVGLGVRDGLAELLGRDERRVGQRRRAAARDGGGREVGERERAGVVAGTRAGRRGGELVGVRGEAGIERERGGRAGDRGRRHERVAAADPVAARVRGRDVVERGRDIGGELIGLRLQRRDLRARRERAAELATRGSAEVTSRVLLPSTTWISVRPVVGSALVCIVAAFVPSTRTAPPSSTKRIWPSGSTRAEPPTSAVSWLAI